MLELTDTTNNFRLYQADASNWPLKPGQGLSLGQQRAWLIGRTQHQIQLLSRELLDSNGNTPQIIGSIAPTPQKNTLIIGQGMGMASAIALARGTTHKRHTACVLATDHLFPFTLSPSKIMAADFPDEMIGSCPLLEDLGILSRAIHSQWQPGCYHGELIPWMNQHSDLISAFDQVILFSEHQQQVTAAEQFAKITAIDAIWTPA